VVKAGQTYCTRGSKKNKRKGGKEHVREKRQRRGRKHPEEEKVGGLTKRDKKPLKGQAPDGSAKKLEGRIPHLGLRHYLCDDETSREKSRVEPQGT